MQMITTLKYAVVSDKGIYYNENTDELCPWLPELGTLDNAKLYRTRQQATPIAEAWGRARLSSSAPNPQKNTVVEIEVVTTETRNPTGL